MNNVISIAASQLQLVGLDGVRAPCAGVFLVEFTNGVDATVGVNVTIH